MKKKIKKKKKIIISVVPFAIDKEKREVSKTKLSLNSYQIKKGLLIFSEVLELAYYYPFH